MPEARSKAPKKATTKTVANKTAPKKKTPIKKVAISKPKKSPITAKVKKKPVKKQVAAKAVRNKVSSKTPAKSAAKTSPVRKTAKRRASVTKKPEVVVLPDRMSIRAREKALVYADYIENKASSIAYAGSFVFGLLFICFGAFIASSSTPFNEPCDNCFAQIISTDPVVTPILDTATAVLEEEILEPVVIPLREIRTELYADFQVYFDTENVSRIEAYLEFYNPNGQQQRQFLPAENTSETRYRVVIPGGSLDPGEYSLKIRAWDTAEQESKLFTIPNDFSVPDTTQAISTASSTGTATDTDLVETVAIPVETENVVPIDAPEQILEEAIDQLDEEIIIAVEPPLVDEVVEEVIAPVEAPIRSIKISSKNDLSGLAAILIDSNTSFSRIDFFIRRSQESQTQNVGRVFAGAETFRLNTRELPDGQYILSAIVSPSTLNLDVTPIKFRIQNELEQVEDLESTSPITINDRPVLSITPEIIKANTSPTIDSGASDQVISDGSSESNSDETIVEFEFSPRESIRERAIEKLVADTDILDALFRNYAIAVQSGNPDLIRESKSEIENYRNRIVSDALVDPTDRFIADNLSEDLETELASLRVKVETFEAVRKEREENETAIDTDQDGITDIDERLLFGTDPLKADTDADGFTDGAEIIKGFNPLDSASEAAIIYQSPKETIGIVPNENLVVKTVEPDIQLGTTSSVQTVVRGKALPNSFVTLYVFSSPTIVTVRTEADGSFEYTFSKELEDGEHQVFVALTDNSGEIVAQSAPFRFVKEAEAFTAVDTNEGQVTPQATITSTSTADPYRNVLAMSVVALGIMLILLGIGLRNNRPETLKLAEITA